MEEQWKPVKGYEGLYEVSNMGRVKSLHYNRSDKEKVMVLGKTTRGYMNVVLCKNKKHRTFTVHRLVAETFIPNPLCLYTVNHKNEIKTDNRVENLEWMSLADQNRYGTRTERAIAKSRITNRNNALSKQVLQFDKNGCFIAEYPPIREVHRLFGFDACHISSCCNNKRNTANGYVWKFKESV